MEECDFCEQVAEYYYSVTGVKFAGDEEYWGDIVDGFVCDMHKPQIEERIALPIDYRISFLAEKETV